MKGERPEISVVVPVYNAAPYLVECVESVLSQTLADFELLLVDDGSTDGSGGLCDALAAKDGRIRVLHQPNRGVSAARNAGLDKAAGTYLLFLDADDLLEQGYLFSDFSFAADLYVQRLYVFGDGRFDTEQPDSQMVGPSEMDRFMEEYGHGDWFRMPSCKFYRSEIIRRRHLRFDRRYRLGEDTLFVMQYMADCCGVSVVSTASYMYRREGLWHEKYLIPMDRMLEYEQAFWHAYRAMGHACPRLLEFAVRWFFNMTEGHLSRRNRFLWLYSPVIVKMNFARNGCDLCRFLKSQCRSTLSIFR